jgi:glycosyltransferase involved in cell wall biosynthesis
VRPVYSLQNGALGVPPEVSVIIPAYRSASKLRICLEHLAHSKFRNYECLVVIDGPLDEQAGIAREFGAAVQSTGQRKGPASARNAGAMAARGNILVFLDADVCVNSETLGRLRDTLEREPELAAVFGSYDDSPKAPDFFSRYRNLMHCYVHRQARRDASTFWSGCGAIRRQVFLDAAGFDESYARPSIEDIELGYRLYRSGLKVALDPAITVKHLKDWSFSGLIRTDILDRGIPWTELILRDRRMPDDLNLRFSQRLSVILVFVLLALAGYGFTYSGMELTRSLAVLACFTLALVGAPGRWYSRPFAAAALPGAICVVSALAFQTHPKIAFFVPAVCMLPQLARQFPFMRWAWMACFLCCGAMAILYLGLRLQAYPGVAAFYCILGVVIGLNYKFYLFLARHMGKPRAILAIPFHLLFHFYNGVSFALGSVRFFCGLATEPGRRSTVVETLRPERAIPANFDKSAA